MGGNNEGFVKPRAAVKFSCSLIPVTHHLDNGGKMKKKLMLFLVLIETVLRKVKHFRKGPSAESIIKMIINLSRNLII